MRGLFLDHSSPEALVADLKRHRHGKFRFKYKGGGRYDRREGSTSPSWRLAAARAINGYGVRLSVEFDNGESAYDLRLDGGWLTYDSTVLMVVQPDQCGSLPSSVDDSQRSRLDDNLKGVFA